MDGSATAFHTRRVLVLAWHGCSCEMLQGRRACLVGSGRRILLQCQQTTANILSAEQGGTSAHIGAERRQTRLGHLQQAGACPAAQQEE